MMDYAKRRHAQLQQLKQKWQLVRRRCVLLPSPTERSSKP
jgi:hypothetical protein